MQRPENKDEKAAREMIRAVYDDGFAEINGRRYDFGKMVHRERRRVFAFSTKVIPLIRVGSFEFLAWDEWEEIEDIIGKCVSFEGMSISKRPGHWDKYPDDYITLISTALGVISIPFQPAEPGN